jgi:RNA polymerase sigma factor (sigma-70 family)
MLHPVIPVTMLTAAIRQPLPTDHSDETLIQAYTQSGSEKAFGALVDKYLGLVLGIAMRRTGDRALAEEITQNVFTALARKVNSLKPGSTLAGWIHRVTVIECAEAMRREISHQKKMKDVSQHLVSEHDGREVWRDALPLLDEGIDALSRAEREVLLLRFFERKSFREIGAALGKSDDAAQKQTERALQKLSGFLKRNGVSMSSAILGTGLSAHLTQAAPSALTHVVAHEALTAASTLNARILIFKTIQAMTNTRLKSAMLATAVLTVPIIGQWKENSRLRESLNLAQQETAIKTNANAPLARITSPSSSSQSRRLIPGSHLSPSDSNSVNLAASDPNAVANDWEHVLFIADPLQRSQRLSELIAALTAEDAPRIAEAFKRVKDAGIRFTNEHRLFLRAWGKLDGSAAVKYSVSHGGQGSDEAVAALGGWSAADPQQARVWLESLPESDSKETLVYGLLDGWSTVDFHAAAAYAESRPSSPARDTFRELLFQRALRSGGISAAQDWVARISENDQNRAYKERAFSDVIQAMLYRDPAAAARWIEELDGQAFVGADAVAKTAAKMAEASPEDALRWLTTLKAADVNGVGRGAGTVLQAWARQSPEAAGGWLNQNPNHPYYDQMTASYVSTVAKLDRSAANAWAQTIRNTEFREATLSSLESRSQISFTASFGSASGGQVGGDLTTLGYELVNSDVQFLTDTLLETGAKGPPVLNITSTAVGGSGKANPHGSGPQWTNCASCHSP